MGYGGSFAVVGFYCLLFFCCCFGFVCFFVRFCCRKKLVYSPRSITFWKTISSAQCSTQLLHSHSNPFTQPLWLNCFGFVKLTPKPQTAHQKSWASLCLNITNQFMIWLVVYICKIRSINNKDSTCRIPDIGKQLSIKPLKMLVMCNFELPRKYAGLPSN